MFFDSRKTCQFGDKLFEQVYVVVRSIESIEYIIEHKLNETDLCGNIRPK